MAQCTFHLYNVPAVQYGGLVPHKKVPAEQDSDLVRETVPSAAIVVRDKSLRPPQNASEVEIHIPGKIPPRPQGGACIYQ